MKKILPIIICVTVLLSVCTVQTFAYGICERFQVDGKFVSSLSNAFNNAVAGSVIKQTGGDETVYLAEENIDVTTDVTLITGKNFSNTIRRIEYSGSDKPLFTVRNGGKLTLQYSEIRLIDTDVAGNGKLIVIEQGGTLVLDGTGNEPVTFLDSSDSTGLILVKNGGKLIFYGATFIGNQSDCNIKVDDGGAVIGDLNGDHVIDICDLLLAKKHLESPEAFPTTYSLDYNCDGNINVMDLILLNKHLLGM